MRAPPQASVAVVLALLALVALVVVLLFTVALLILLFDGPNRRSQALIIQVRAEAARLDQLDRDAAISRILTALECQCQPSSPTSLSAVLPGPPEPPGLTGHHPPVAR